MKITVEGEEKNPINFDLEKDYITLDALKLYFPEAVGLKYWNNNEWHYVNFENGKFQLKTDIEAYKVHFTDAPPKVSIPSKRKFDYTEILNKLKKKSKPQMDEELKKEISSKKKIGKVKHEKIVSIGWKHRDSIKSEFYKPNSGTKKVTLDVNKIYTVSDIKIIAINLFKNEYNEKFFENSSSQICLNNGTPIDAFSSDKGENIWDCKTILDKAGRILTLYLQTTNTQVNKERKSELLSATDKSEKSVSDSPKNVPVNIKIDEKQDVADKGKMIDTLTIEKLPDCPSVLKKVPSNAVDDPIFNVSPIKPKMQLQDMCNIKLPLIIEIPKENLEFSDTVLGRGSFGTVQKGKWNGTKVAIKTIEMLLSNPKDIIKEVAVLRQVTHENVVSIMGICIEEFQIHIIMELVDGYSLRDIIYKENVKMNYIKKIFDKNLISSQICRAITFLHLHPQKFLHRDIKPANILVTKNKIVKVCDLGLAKMQGLLSQLQTTVGKRQIIGTPLYMAPEIFFRRSEYTQFADVWSLGCTLLELYDEKPMWRITAYNFSLDEILKNETVPDLRNVPEFLQEILKQCFNYDFQKRPIAKELLKAFDVIENDN